MYIFYFCVEVNNNDKNYKGIVVGKNFVDASKKLEAYYGNDLNKFVLEIIGDGELIFISDQYSSIVEDIKENSIW